MKPTLADVVIAATRRLSRLSPGITAARFQESRREILEQARNLPSRTGPWRETGMERYSARQKTNVELHGVVGSIELPTGAGELWPLLAAAAWVGIGKGTTVGMGTYDILPLTGSA